MRAFVSRTSFRAPAIVNQLAKGPCRSTAAAAIGSGSGATNASRRNGKLVWLSTTSQDALTAGLEAGLDTVVFDESQAAVSNEWQQLGRFTAITRAADGRLLDAASGAVVGHVRLLSSPEDLRAAEREAATVQGVVVMDASDWQIIPAENLVAAYAGNTGATLLAAAPDCASGRTMLEALEAGTDGVLLQTDSPAEVGRACSRHCTAWLEAVLGSSWHVAGRAEGRQAGALALPPAAPVSLCVGHLRTVSLPTAAPLPPPVPVLSTTTHARNRPAGEGW
jgi:hypothetical protein